MLAFGSATISVILAVTGLWDLRIGSVYTVSPTLSDTKISVKRIYLLGDRHYVNKVKFFIIIIHNDILVLFLSISGKPFHSPCQSIQGSCMSVGYPTDKHIFQVIDTSRT